MKVCKHSEQTGIGGMLWCYILSQARELIQPSRWRSKQVNR